MRSARSVLDQLLLSTHELGEEERRRGRLLSVMSLALAPFSALFAAMTWISTGGLNLSSVILGCGAIIALANVGVVRSGQLNLGGRIIVGAMLLVVPPLPWLDANSGLFDPSQLWLVVPPVLALFAIGRRWAIGVVILELTHFTALFLVRGDMTRLNLTSDHNVFYFASLGTVIVALLLLAGAFEGSRRDAQAQLAQAIEEAKGAARELVELNEDVEAARTEAERRAEVQRGVVQLLQKHFESQGRAIEETASALERIAENQRAVSEAVRSARDSTRASTASLAGISEQGERAAARGMEMAAATQQAVATLDGVAQGGREVAGNVDELSGYAEATRKAMAEMRSALDHMATNARHAKALAERVIQSSTYGAEAVARANEGMEAIRDSSHRAGENMRELNARIGEVGKILAVIEDVAEETQLLSLNASIIASQAGEQGRAFSVVAAEIKKLAERTSVSAGEIGAIVKGVQSKSAEAVSAIEAGERAVDDGLQRSIQARRALADIVEASDETMNVVSAIDDLAADQEQRSQHVTDLATLVAGNASEIARVTSRHAARTAEIGAVASTLREAAAEIEEMTQQQRRTSVDLVTEVESIERRMERIQRSQDAQTEGVERIVEAVETLRSSQREQARSVASLSEEAGEA